MQFPSMRYAGPRDGVWSCRPKSTGVELREFSLDAKSSIFQGFCVAADHTDHSILLPAWSHTWWRQDHQTAMTPSPLGYLTLGIYGDHRWRIIKSHMNLYCGLGGFPLLPQLFGSCLFFDPYASSLLYLPLASDGLKFPSSLKSSTSLCLPVQARAYFYSCSSRWIFWKDLHPTRM